MSDEDGRRAALALHALTRQDQRWVMNRLAPPQRQRVAGLLGELQALHIPADRTLLPLPPTKRQAPPAPPADETQPPRVMARQLTGEQPFVVAACLLDLAPDAQDQVLAQLAPTQAAAARRLMATDLPQAHALRQAVRTAVQARPAPPQDGPVEPRGWRTRLRAWLPARSAA